MGSVARQIIPAQLIAHDEEDIMDFAGHSWIIGVMEKQCLSGQPVAILRTASRQMRQSNQALPDCAWPQHWRPCAHPCRASFAPALRFSCRSAYTECHRPQKNVIGHVTRRYIEARSCLRMRSRKLSSSCTPSRKTTNSGKYESRPRNSRIDDQAIDYFVKAFNHAVNLAHAHTNALPVDG